MGFVKLLFALVMGGGHLDHREYTLVTGSGADRRESSEALVFDLMHVFILARSRALAPCG